MPTELLSTERASVIATICFFLDFFLIIVILTSLETVFLAQLFRNLQPQNRRPLGSPYNPILYTFSKNFKGVNCTKKSLHGNFG